MTAAGFDGRAGLASGSTPVAPTPYRVTVAAGSLRLGPAGTSGVLLDVPLSRVRARPLGRAGSVVLEVDRAPMLVNFGGQGSRRTGARLLAAGRGRIRRARFLRALRRARP